MIDGTNETAPLGICGNETGMVSGAPVISAKNLRVTGANVVPVLIRTKVVCHPLPVAICAMLPSVIPTERESSLTHYSVA